MHRAAQIVDAIDGLIRARVSAAGVKVFKHTRTRLDYEQDELPAISIDYGEDSPDVGATLNELASVLTVEFNAVAQAPIEAELHDTLMELRAEIHVALMANFNLGLQFVEWTQYGPVDAPDINQEGETITGSLKSRWLIHYSMGSDPN